MYLFDHDLTPAPPLQPQPRLFDEWLDAKGEEFWCGECDDIAKGDECIHRKPVRPTVLTRIESPHRRRYMSAGLYPNERDQHYSPPYVYLDPIATLIGAQSQPEVQAAVYETIDTTITRMPTPYHGVQRTPPRSSKNLDAIHEELDFDVFDGNRFILREAGNPVLESTPPAMRLGSPTSQETPRRSKRLQMAKDFKESLPKTPPRVAPIPKTPSRIGLIHVDQNMASPISPKKGGPRTSAKENGRVRPVSSSPRKRKSFGKATRMEE